MNRRKRCGEVRSEPRRMTLPARACGRVFALSLAFALPGWSAAAQEQIGTITADVNGEPHTWYVVTGESGGRPYGSAAWVEMAPGRRMVTVGGFDTPDPPLETFTRDARGTPTSYGDYDGSLLAVVVEIPESGTSVSVTLPGQPQMSGVSYQPRASLQNVTATTQMMYQGTLDVSRVEIVDGLAVVEGTFRGAFRSMTGSEHVRITNGRFEIEGIPPIEALR